MGDGYLSLVRRLAAVARALAGVGDEVAGLAGARLLAALFITIAVAAMWRAAVVLFDARSAFFALPSPWPQDRCWPWAISP